MDINLKKYNKIPSVIKYTGSKRNYINEILPFIPKDINIFHEPFCGSAAVSLSMMKNDFNVKKYILSDINEDVINLLNLIKCNPEFLANAYEIMWRSFNENENNHEHRKNFFYYVRKNFNYSKKPELFFFLQRTSANGMVRYNLKNEYNSPCHFSRPGMNPEKAKKDIIEISELLKNNNVEIIKKSYLDFDSFNHFMFIDPPYKNTKGLYKNSFDDQAFFNWLDNDVDHFILTYDKSVYNKFNYKKYIEMEPKISSFRNNFTKNKGTKVSEGLYIK